MEITFTARTLDKLEALLKSLNYKVRYEKGNFKTGACVLESSRVVVINKFSDLESRIMAIISLLKTIEIDEALLDEKQAQFLYLLKKSAAAI